MADEEERARYPKRKREECVSCVRCSHACHRQEEIVLGVWLRGEGNSWLCVGCCTAISQTWQCRSCWNYNAGDEFCRCTDLEKARKEGMVEAGMWRVRMLMAGNVGVVAPSGTGMAGNVGVVAQSRMAEGVVSPSTAGSSTDNAVNAVVMTDEQLARLPCHDRFPLYCTGDDDGDDED